MKRKRFTSDQITASLYQVDVGNPAKELCRQHGFTEQTYYRWKKQYAGIGLAEVRELREVRKENGRLKKLIANLSLDKQMLQELLKKKFLSGPSHGSKEKSVR